MILHFCFSALHYYLFLAHNDFSLLHNDFSLLHNDFSLLHYRFSLLHYYFSPLHNDFSPLHCFYSPIQSSPDSYQGQFSVFSEGSLRSYGESFGQTPCLDFLYFKIKQCVIRIIIYPTILLNGRIFFYPALYSNFHIVVAGIFKSIKI